MFGRRLITISLGSALLLWVGLPLNGDDYAKVLRNSLGNTLGADFKSYEWLSYPTGNFGVGTMFILESSRAKPSVKNQWCATYTCLGLDENRLGSNLRDQLGLAGYADLGAGGAVALTQEQNQRMALDVFLPRIYGVLGASGAVSEARYKSVSMTLGAVTKRFLNKQKVLERLEKLAPSGPLYRAFNQNRLAIVVADAVIDTVRVDVEFQDDLSPQLNATLDSPSAVAGRTGFSLKAKRVGNRKVSFVISQPVVIARITVRRALGGREAEAPGNLRLPDPLRSWDAWIPAAEQ